MITTKTTLVLGAGASEPYGFPLGQKLVSIIGNQLSHSIDPNWIKHLENNNHTKKEIKAFAEALKASGKYSIDAFLTRQPKYLELGKLCIALTLIPCENPERLYSPPPEKDWYRALFECMDSEFEEFGDNQLSIVTFNYDRSLEYSLIRKMMYTYENTEAECYAQLKKIPIIHVHGKLGGYQWEPGQIRRYLPNIEFVDEVNSVKDDIIVISENTKKHHEYEDAYDIIHRSKRIYFMGFGYHDSNLKRLGITELKNDLFGTCMSIGDARRDELFNKYRIVLNNKHFDNLAYMNNVVVFND